MVEDKNITDSIKFISGYYLDDIKWNEKGKIKTICSDNAKDNLPLQIIRMAKDYNQIKLDYFNTNKTEDDKLIHITH